MLKSNLTRGHSCRTCVERITETGKLWQNRISDTAQIGWNCSSKYHSRIAFLFSKGFPSFETTFCVFMLGGLLTGLTSAAKVAELIPLCDSSAPHIDISVSLLLACWLLLSSQSWNRSRSTLTNDFSTETERWQMRTKTHVPRSLRWISISLKRPRISVS